MSDGKTMLKRAVMTARAGKKDEARQMLGAILARKPQGDLLTETLFWLSELSRSPRERHGYLKKLLQIEPTHARGRKRWQELHEQARRAEAREQQQEERDEGGKGKIRAIRPLKKSEVAEEVAEEPAEAAGPIIDMDKPMCPECNRRMFFLGTGRTLMCDYCNYKYELPLPPRQTIQQLVEDLKMVPQGDEARIGMEGETMRTFGLHDMIQKGRADLKAGNHDEAYFYFTHLLLSGAGTLKDRIEAWYGLSQVCEDAEEIRICLDQALGIDPAHPEARRALAVLEGRLKAEQLIDSHGGVARGEGGTLAGQAEQMVCPQCAGRMNFAADERQTLVCEFCGYEEVMSEAGPVGRHMGEKDFVVAMATAKGHRPPVDMRTFQCQSCAVEFVLAPEMLSLTCPYCDSVYVTEAAETDEIVPPDGLIPFTVPQDKAERGWLAWVKGVGIEPSYVSPLVGIYLPVWTFDISGPLVWRALISQGGGEAEWRSGEHYVLYDDLLIPASDKLADDLVPHLETFNYGELVTYDGRYLADWPAERYTRTVGDASLLARKNIMNEMRKSSARLTGTSGAQQFTVRSRGGLSVETYKLVLLPFWMLHYKQDDVLYDVIINGQTGEVFGQKPKGLLGKLASWLFG
ncbi:MAG TPA: hypothetical protein VLL52_02830 [Anaerolineae bacterium]|nr:hypothetical protein [Anaerolineae bacterium]